MTYLYHDSQLVFIASDPTQRHESLIPVHEINRLRQVASDGHVVDRLQLRCGGRRRRGDPSRSILSSVPSFRACVARSWRICAPAQRRRSAYTRPYPAHSTREPVFSLAKPYRQDSGKKGIFTVAVPPSL